MNVICLSATCKFLDCCQALTCTLLGTQEYQYYDPPEYTYDEESTESVGQPWIEDNEQCSGNTEEAVLQLAECFPQYSGVALRRMLAAAGHDAAAAAANLAALEAELEQAAVPPDASVPVLLSSEVSSQLESLSMSSYVCLCPHVLWGP